MFVVSVVVLSKKISLPKAAPLVNPAAVSSVLLILLLLVMVLAGCVSQSAPQDGQPDKNTTLSSDDLNTADPRTGTQIVGDSIVAALVDGVYGKQMQYVYHPGLENEGTERVDFSITLSDEVVTAVSVSGNDPNPISKMFIEKVNAALPDLVVGKKIMDVNVPKQVAGSSLTTGAFKAFVAEVVAGDVQTAS